MLCQGNIFGRVLPGGTCPESQEEGERSALPSSGGDLKTRGAAETLLKRPSVVLRDSLCLCRSQLVLDVARVLWCNCLSLWIVNSLLLKGAEQNYYFYSQLERADSFPTENMTTQKIICQSLFFWVFFSPWVLANFLFLVVIHTCRFPIKSYKC